MSLYNLEGIDTELELYTCPSCEQTMQAKEMILYFNCDYVEEKFRIAKILQKLNLSHTEKALVAAISILATGKIYHK